MSDSETLDTSNTSEPSSETVTEEQLSAENEIESGFKKIDFSKSPDGIALYPRLLPVLELFILEYAHHISKFLNRRTTVKLHRFEFCTFGDYILKLQDTCVYCLINIRSHQQYALITLPYEFLYFTINSLYGGQYQASQGISKNIGKVGIKIIQRILNLIFSVLKTSWAEITTFEFEFMKIYTNPQLITKISQREILSQIRYNIDFSDLTSWFDISIPRILLDENKPKLQIEEVPLADPADDYSWHNALKDEILNTNIHITAKLPPINMTLKDILNLNVGDVVSISDPREVEVYAGEKCLYRAIAGIQDTQRVIKIIGIYEK